MRHSYLGSVEARIIIVSLLVGLGLGVQVACSSDSAEPAECEEGAEGCSCYPNETCESGLECHSGLCVEPGSEGSSGGSSGDSGGSSSGGSTSDGGSSSGGSSNDGGSSSAAGGSSSDAGGSSGDAGGAGGTANCEVGAQGCSCNSNSTCDEGLECRSDLCVEAGSSTSSGGAGGTQGTGGSTTTNAGGMAGTAGGTSSGTGGSTHSGTGGSTTNGTGGTGGSEGSDPAVIDDFSSCDGDISRVDGRDGYWFTFGDDEVNVVPTTDVGAQTPPSEFDDPSCAAWYTTACAEAAIYCSFAGLGFVFFEDESAYDLSSYQALQIQREGDAQWIVVHMTGGLTFGASLPSGLGTDSVYFYTFVPSGDTDIYAVPDWSQVTKIEFTSLTPEASGFAIYDIRLL